MKNKGVKGKKGMNEQAKEKMDVSKKGQPRKQTKKSIV